MRKMLLLSAALMSFAAPAAFAQTSAASPTAPAETSAPPLTPSAKPMPRTMRAAPASPVAEIRPGHEPGVGESFPASNIASNITPSDTRSPIAPRLPAPGLGENATPAQFLAAARQALDGHQTGKAQEALERAETAMLQRSVPADLAATPDSGPRVMQVKMARDALAHGDVQGARKAIAVAMAAG